MDSFMVSHHFQSLTGTGPHAQAKREIMYRNLGDVTQENCKEGFVLFLFEL